MEYPGAKPGHVKTLRNKLRASGIDRNKYWPRGQGRHEVTFALNLKTLEVKWFKGKREKADEWKLKFSVHPEWIAGTIDWVGNDGLIGDLKTGRWPVEAKGNKQLLSYALPFWLADGAPSSYVRPLRIEQWPKYPLAGLPELKYARATGLDLALHLEDLRWAVENGDEANPNIDTCRFCQGKANCSDFILSGISYKKDNDV